jgi:hypothetical protein
MNKYQEALDNLVHCKSITRCKECKHKDLCTMERDSKILQELVDKETPKKPVTIIGLYYNTGRIKCPTCNHQLPMKKNCVSKRKTILYCNRCGQKLDWEE